MFQSGLFAYGTFPLFGPKSRFDFFDFVLEGLVYLYLVFHHLAGMEYGSMVFVSDELADFRRRGIGMLLGQIHGYLSYLYHFALAGLGVDGGRINLVVAAYLFDDVVYGNRFDFRAFHRFLHDALSQFQVDFALEQNGLSQQGVHDTFQFTHAFVHVLGNVADDRFRNDQSVLLDLVPQDILSQFDIRLFQLGHQSPFETGEQTFLHAL